MHGDEQVEFDIALKHLQDRYDFLVQRKKNERKETRKKTLRGPTVKQKSWYEEGWRKLRLERSKEEEQKNKPPKTSATPAKVCDRLYEQGMMKIYSEKLREKGQIRTTKLYNDGIITNLNEVGLTRNHWVHSPEMRYRTEDTGSTRLFTW